MLRTHATRFPSSATLPSSTELSVIEVDSQPSKTQISSSPNVFTHAIVGPSGPVETRGSKSSRASSVTCTVVVPSSWKISPSLPPSGKPTQTTSFPWMPGVSSS